MVALVRHPTEIWRGVFRALDRPAREALELARKPVHHALAPAALGLFFLASATAAAAALAPDGRGGATDGLRSVLEALGVALPATWVMGTWMRLRTPPGVLGRT